MKVVNQPLRKKDAMQLVTGQPVYVDDVTPRDCLCVKLLRSPHANAIVKSINKTAAMKVPGMEAIFTWEDVDQDGRRYTQAGQTYPEASPYDRLVIDRHVRFVGDVVAILAGADEKCVDKAMKLVKVEYEVLEPVLDFHTAKDNPVLVHPEDNWESLAPVGADNRRNLCAHDECGNGDIDAVLADCDVVIDRVYHTQACQQAMMETFRTYCEIDTYGRLHIISSTQIVFHTRRIVANALHIPKSKVRVTKPRIGGGFGAKQTAVSAVYPAFVTW
ncbi:MAG: molybdopterin cofactor-binding domain-containing protein, partial [Eubacteriales bacterium]|nr:molybdopterin cofactor-binding domain-containing protein [Eubacteriales bacterium]